MGMSSIWIRRSVSLYLYLNTILITSYFDNMKKVLFSILLVLGMSLMFCSCEKEEGGEGNGTTIKSSDIIGSWAPTDYEYVNFYWEFTKDGMVKYYEAHNHGGNYCSFSNGTFYVPKEYEWELDMYGKYVIEENIIFFEGMRMGSIKRINKDTYIFNSDLLVDGTVQRIKKFSKK